MKGFMKTSIFAILALLLSTSIAGMPPSGLVLANVIPSTRLLLNVYIRSDGSIDPPTAPIRRIGNVYIFTSNILDHSIIVQHDNIVIDGAGYGLVKLGVKGGEGVVLMGRSNVTIRNLGIQGFHYAIVIKNSSHINVVGNCILKNHYAISLEYSSYVNITKNVICAVQSFGVNLWMSDNTYIAKNRIENSTHGMGLWRSSNSIIYENHIANNNIGIWLSAANNTIYNNNFISNTEDVHVDQHGFPEIYSNFFDDGAEGNYWSSYDGVDSDNDGIGDTPYIIDGYNIDHYPQMKPFTILELPEQPEGANVEPSYPLIAMLEEYINCIITKVNGSLWVKVDATYFLNKIFGAGDFYNLNGVEYIVLSDELPLLYPVPPGTTNLSIKFNGRELNWINYTETHPGEWYFTSLGWWFTDLRWWPMIYFKINEAPHNFTLKIHYEHPIPIVNGSYTLLYILNVKPYLSPWYNKSTAYFNIRIETNYKVLHAYTIGPDKWNPVNYTITDNGLVKVASIKITSEYDKPLPGDLVIIFGENSIPSENENFANSSPSLEHVATVAGIATFVAFAGCWFFRRKRRICSQP